MPNTTSPNSPTPSQNPSTCPEDSASTTTNATGWPDWQTAVGRDDDDGGGGGGDRSPSPAMSGFHAAADVPGSPATDKSATLSPGRSQSTPGPESVDADSIRGEARAGRRGGVVGEEDGELDFREEEVDGGDGYSAVSMGRDYSSLRVWNHDREGGGGDAAPPFVVLCWLT